MHGCECNTGGSDYRHFLTKDEKAKMLEEYKDWLESEAKGVSEAITELKKAK